MRDKLEAGKFDETFESFRLAILDGLGNCENKEEIAINVLEKIASNFSGQIIYVSQRFFTYLRNNQIKSEFNGRNHAELALKYNISVQWIYKIVKGEV